MINRNATNEQLIRWPAIIAAFVFSLNAFAKTPFTNALSLSSNAHAAKTENRPLSGYTETQIVQKEPASSGWFDHAEEKEQQHLDCLNDYNRITREIYFHDFNFIRGAGSRF